MLTKVSILLTVIYFIYRLFNKEFLPLVIIAIFFICFSQLDYSGNLILLIVKGVILGALFSAPIFYIDLYSKITRELFFPNTTSAQTFFSLALLFQLFKLDYLSYIFNFNLPSIIELEKIVRNYTDVYFIEIKDLLALSLFLALIFIYLVLLSQKSIPKSFFKITSVVIILTVFIQSLESYNSIYSDIINSQNILLEK